MKPPKLEEFHRQAGAGWARAIESLGIGRQASATWSELDAIKDALRPFMGEGLNHAHFPTGGGLDFLSVGPAREQGCLEVVTGDKLAEVFKPGLLTLEHFPQHPQESFLLIELQTLIPTGIYDKISDDYEELLDVPGEGYMRRDVWDRGYLGLDEHEHEIAIPEDARLISRRLGGKMLLVANGSLWNSAPETYDGRHNRMTAAQIRKVIERALARQA
jgi:hypothetical protein